MSAVLSQAAFADENTIRIFTTLESEIYTEAQPIKPFVDDFDAPLETGDSAFTYNQFELGVGYNQWQFGWQSRYDWTMKFDPDTARYMHIDKNNLDYEARNYRYYLDAQNITSHGVFLAYQFDLPEYKLSVQPKVSYFQSSHFQDGLVDGEIFGDSDQGDLSVDYYFSKDRLFKSFSPPPEPNGSGYSIDLDIEYQALDELRVGLKIKDLVHKIDFDQSGYVQGETSDIPFTTDANGNVVTQPTLRLQTSENNNFKAHSFSLPTRYRLWGDYRINNDFSTQLDIYRFASDTFVSGKVSWHFWDTSKLYAGYQTGADAFIVGVRSQYMGLEFKTDNTNLDKAYYASLNWYLQVSF